MDQRRLGRRAIALAGLLVVTVTGCGSADDAAVVRQTATKLADIASGQVTMRLESTGANGADDRRQLRLEISGLFSFVSAGPLPALDIDYSLTADGHRTDGGLLSTGQRAYVEKGGTFYEFPQGELGPLRIDPARPVTTGFSQLHMERWLRNPKVSDGHPVAGVSTDRIRGEVDVAAALDDLLSLARGLGLPAGSGPGALSSADTVQLARLVKSANVDILTGAGDRLLRRLIVEVDLAGVEGLAGGGGFSAGPASDPVAAAITALAGQRLRLELNLNDPNREVTVAEPAGALPLDQIPRS